MLSVKVADEGEHDAEEGSVRLSGRKLSKKQEEELAEV